MGRSRPPTKEAEPLKLNESFPATRKLFLAVLMSAMSLLSICEGANFSVKPSVEVGEQYNDNVFLSREGRIADNITEAQPSLALTYRTPVVDTKMDYSLVFWHYWRLASNKYAHNLDLSSKVTAVENLIYLDVSDRYDQAVLNPKRPSAENNPFANQTNVNTFLVSPYMKYQINPLALFSAGYRYANIWHNEKDALNRQQHAGFANIQYTLSSNVNAYAGLEYLEDMPESGRPEAIVADRNNQKAVYMGLKYAIDPFTDFEGTVGYRWIDFEKAKNEATVTYKGTLSRRFSETGTVGLKAETGFATDPLLGVEKTTTEEVSIRFGSEIIVSGVFFHRRHRYIESGDRIDSLGAETNAVYRTDSGLTFSVSGGYERRRLNPGSTTDNVYRAGGEASRKLAENTGLALSYNYYRDQSTSGTNDITNNIMAVRFRHTF